MKKIATGVVLAALVMASATPALAATNRPVTTTIDASLLASTVPTTFAATSTNDTSSTADSASSSSSVSDPTLYSGLLSYFKADLNYQGAVYQAFVDAGLSTSALSSAYAKLDTATTSLIAYLQTKVTSA